MFKNNSDSIMNLTIDLSGWDVSNVEDMSHMFVNRFIHNEKNRYDDFGIDSVYKHNLIYTTYHNGTLKK